MTRWCIVIVFCLALAPLSHAQQSPQTRREIWPELDIHIPLNSKFRLVLSASSQKASESGDKLEGQGGIAVDYFWRNHWALRTGYHYGFSSGSSEHFPEHTVLTEQTYRRVISERFVFTDRNREEFRWLDGDYSMRFRNRAKLERPFEVGGRSLAPYGSAEIFYDTRFSTFNRYRLVAGTELRFRKRDIKLLNVRRQQVLDLYYLWQSDSRSQTKHLQALGITFEVHF